MGDAPQDERLESLISLAEKVLECPVEERDSFIEQVDSYLNALESWRTDIEEKMASQSELPPSLRERVELLNSRHQELMRRADFERQALTAEMGEAKKKASALRAYVDRFPQRITIAGKRKG